MSTKDILPVVETTLPSNIVIKEDSKQDEHMVTIKEICERYKVNVNSPEPDKVSEGKQSQCVTPPKRKPAIVKYRECLSSLFIMLMLVAGILMYILLGIDPLNNQANIYLSAILLGVAFVKAIIEFYRLQKSAKILESFPKPIPPTAHVIREGRLYQIDASTLVCGDVVFLRIGDKVPADIVLFNATEMKVDNSSLTGEAEPQDRQKTNTHTNPLEATNICFNGTLVVSGEGYGIVIRTGDRTMLGQIAYLAASEKLKSPLSREIDNFVLIIAGIAVITALVFFGIGMDVYNGNA